MDNKQLKRKISNVTHDRTLRNGILFSGFSFINRGFTFLLLIILANFISPAEYGYLNLFSTVVMVVGYVMALSSEGYLAVAYFNEGNSGITNTFSSVLYTSVIISLVLYIGIFIGGTSLCNVLELPFTVLILAVVIGFFTIYVNLNLDLFRIEEKVKAYGVLSCGNALLNFVISILLVKTLMYGWQGRVYAQTLCFILFGIIGFVYFIKSKHLTKPNWTFWKSMLLWGVPLIPHHATNFLRQGCDRYIINNYHSIDDVGIFSLALNLANIIIMIGAGFNQSNSVDIYKTLGDSSISISSKLLHLKKQRRKIMLVYIVTGVLTTIACLVTVPYLLPSYAESLKYFPILAVYATMVCLYFLDTNYLFYFKKTKTIMLTTFGSAVLHLLLSLLLTPFSLYITCLVYCISQASIVLIIHYLSYKELQKRLV